MIDDDTIEIIYHDHSKIDLEAIKAAFAKYDAFTTKRLKKLTIAGEHTEITAEARKYGHEQSKARRKFIIAEALVVNSLPQKMVANFYSAFIKDLYPIKYFTDAESAKQWLDEIRDDATFSN